MPMKAHRPGETAPHSGQYSVFGPLGGKTGKEQTVTKGEPLPSIPERGQRYKVADSTKHYGVSGSSPKFAGFSGKAGFPAATPRGCQQESSTHSKVPPSHASPAGSPFKDAQRLPVRRRRTTWPEASVSELCDRRRRAGSSPQPSGVLARSKFHPLVLRFDVHHGLSPDTMAPMCVWGGMCSRIRWNRQPNTLVHATSECGLPIGI